MFYIFWKILKYFLKNNKNMGVSWKENNIFFIYFRRWEFFFVGVSWRDLDTNISEGKNGSKNQLEALDGYTDNDNVW